MEQLLSTKEAAEILGVSPSTLEKWRNRTLFGVPFFTADEQHGGTWYYYRERVEQLKAIYQPGILQDMYKLEWLSQKNEITPTIDFQKSATSGELKNLKEKNEITPVTDFQKSPSSGELKNLKSPRGHKGYVSTEQVAELFGVTFRAVEKWVEQGFIRWDRFDHHNRWLFKKQTVEDFAERRHRKKLAHTGRKSGDIMHEEFFDDDSGFVCSDERPADISQADLDEMLRDAHERDDAEQSEQFQASQDSGGENCHDYYITNADENKSDAQIVTPDSNTGTTRDKRKKKEKISDEEYHRRAANDIAESKRRLSELPSSDRRGLDDETYQQLGFGFLPNWKHPKNPDAIPTPRFIARLGDANDPPAYNAILTPSGRERFGNSKLWEARKCLTAVAKLVFHPSALTASLVAITEGEMDTASIWQCLKRGKIIDAGTCSGVDVCALGGTDGAVEDLIKRLEAMEVKPRVILLFDGDDTGRTDDKKPGRIRAKELQKQLWAIGVVAVCEFFEDVLSDDEKKEIGDKPDANQILKTKGDDYLYYRFARTVKKAQGDFKQAEEEMKRWREYEQAQSTKSASDDLKPSTRENQSAAKGNYDPEIQNLIDEINNTITCEMLEQKGIIEHSKRGKARPEGYVCLYCGSGTKKEKTGELCFTKTLPLLFRCRACGKPGNVLTLLSQVWSIPRKGKEFFDLLKKTADEFGIHYDPKIFDTTRRRRNDNRDETIAALFEGGASDRDFAKRLVLFCGDIVRWVKNDKSWITYERNEQGGGKWGDVGNENSSLAPQLGELADTLTTHARNKREREVANAFQATRKQMQAVTQLKGIKPIYITSEDLNNHPELLNCLNGVVDLRSGSLMEAAPELLITQQCPAVFNPKCTDKTFANFLESALPDTDTRTSVISFLGYCLTADVSAEKYLNIYGLGGNGKGTLLLTLRILLGDYGCELSIDAVLEGGKSSETTGRATTELNALVGRRLGIVDELPRSRRWDIAKLNRLSGGDYLPVRKLHKEGVDVPPTHKLIMCSNYFPRIDDPRADSVRRRLIVVEFGEDFTQNPDTSLKARLQTPVALSGALNVLVPAAVEFYKHGLLKPSKKMEQAREELLGASDFIADFIADHCITGADCSIKRKDILGLLRNVYKDECERYRDSDLVAMLTKVDGVTKDKDRTNANIFRGIRRLTSEEYKQRRKDSKDVSQQSEVPFIGESIDLENPPF